MGLRTRLRALLSPPSVPHRDVAASPEVRVTHGPTNRIDAVFNALSGLGTTYDKGTGNAVNLAKNPPTVAELAALYRDNGYAGRLIDIVPDDATRKGWKVVDSSSEQALMEAEDARLSIVARFQTAHRWAREQGGAGLLIVTDDVSTDDGEGWDEPLDPAKVGRVDNLVPLERVEMFAAEWEDDAASTALRPARGCCIRLFRRPSCSKMAASLNAR